VTWQPNGIESGGLRVLAETAYPEQTAASRVRVANFAPFLRSHGVELRLHPMLSDSEYERFSSHASVSHRAVALATAAARAAVRERPAHDVLLVQRLRFLSPLPWVDPPSRLDVYDFDDALFAATEGGQDQHFQWVKQEARRCVAYLRRTKLAIAGNSFLAGVARQYVARDARVEVVPSCLDPTRQELHDHSDADELIVGWIGSRSTSQYLRAVLPAIERLNARRIKSRLVLVGADPSIVAPWIEHRPWSIETQERDLASFDVGIMPLTDNNWSRGKCGYKVLQYFAAGVPAVASPVGVARDLIGEDRGLLARTSEEWTWALQRLLSDVQERHERGMAAREFVERHYSYQRWAPELAELLRSV
jgi:glycosyltransferase involved in cell wall biosynthesis